MRPMGAELHLHPGYGRGIYRRRIEIRSDEGLVRGELEDDFHRFGAVVRHDGRAVLEARGSATRFPWTTCPEAVSVLAELAGVPLSPSLRAIARARDPRRHCTHLFDLASLLVARAAAGGGDRFYDVEVPDLREGGGRARLWRDGAPILDLEVRGLTLEGPEPFRGRPLTGGFAEWAEETLAPDLAEAAQVLRRAVLIAGGRRFDMERMESAVPFAPLTRGACYSFQPERIARALRNRGSVRDFSRRPGALLAGSGRGDPGGSAGR